MADWLLFAVVYLWAGSWHVELLDAADPLKTDKNVDKALYFAMWLGWPLVMIAAPFAKLPKGDE